MDSEKACLLCILKVRGLGPQNLKKLKNQIGTCREVWKAPVEQLTAVVGPKLAQGLMEVRSSCDPEEELGRCLNLGIEVLAEFDERYPQSTTLDILPGKPKGSGRYGDCDSWVPESDALWLDDGQKIGTGPGKGGLRSS
jgi:hypothetical protein